MKDSLFVAITAYLESCGVILNESDVVRVSINVETKPFNSYLVYGKEK